MTKDRRTNRSPRFTGYHALSQYSKKSDWPFALLFSAYQKMGKKLRSACVLRWQVG